jgi:hypothetical protein
VNSLTAAPRPGKVGEGAILLFGVQKKNGPHEVVYGQDLQPGDPADCPLLFPVVVQNHRHLGMIPGRM